MMDVYTIRLVLQMLLIGVASVAAYVFHGHQLYFCVFFSLALVLVTIVHLVYLYARVTRRIVRMIDSIKYGNFTISFPEEKQSRWEREMVEKLNASIVLFRSKLSEKEAKYRYLETLLDTVETDVLVLDKEGRVVWMNRASIHDLCGYTIHQLEELKLLNADFPTILNSLVPGDVKVVRIYKGEMMQDMAVTVTEYSSMGLELRLISLKNLRSILEENEMEAWQKLVRILTHEIMNSITPIISLSDTLCDRAVQKGMDESDMVLQGMKAIHRRSKGLLTFVENYRKLSGLASPVMLPVRIGDLLGDIKKLFPASKVRYVYQIENEDQMLMVDRSQMEQVLINLLKNAGEACYDQPHPEVVVKTNYQAKSHIFQLSVTDNGCGILPSVMDKIFIPFFTTKPTGSGIGLSLCKQIMTLHGGTMQVSSEDGKGSCFTLKLLVK